MSFTDEKITVLYSLLSKYTFSSGFTYYFTKVGVSDTGYYSTFNINLSGHGNLSKQTLSSGGNLALFPIIFDYFDAVLDKKLSVKNINFKKKQSLLFDLNRNDAVIGFLENETFGKALELRNKIIHNDLIISQDTGEISLPSGQKYKIDDFHLLNRLVFNVALMCDKNKNYNLYKKSAALSLHEKFFDIELPDAVKTQYQKGRLVKMNTHARMYSDLSKKTISSSEPLFDALSESIEYTGGNGESKFKKDIYGNRTFKLKSCDIEIIIPAELILKNKNLAIQDVRDWCI